MDRTTVERLIDTAQPFPGDADPETGVRAELRRRNWLTVRVPNCDHATGLLIVEIAVCRGWTLTGLAMAEGLSTLSDYSVYSFRRPL